MLLWILLLNRVVFGSMENEKFTLKLLFPFFVPSIFLFNIERCFSSIWILPVFTIAYDSLTFDLTHIFPLWYVIDTCAYSYELSVSFWELWTRLAVLIYLGLRRHVEKDSLSVTLVANFLYYFPPKKHGPG